MHPGDEWNSIRKDRLWPLAGIGAVRLALLFGFVIVAFALMVVPVADRHSRVWLTRVDSSSVDNLLTGTVKRNDAYTVRRSVLQASPTSVCIIRSNGARTGNC